VREIGRYRVERELGRGGMAIVHLARQADLERPVALKELAGLMATDPTAITRFLREARLAGSLNHPNIVTVYEYFEYGGLPYIAMEFLPRGPLRPLVGRLKDPQVVGVLDCMLAGLAHADAHGIVHRDLKPENVMRTQDGWVKIADFGIATAYYGELAHANLTPPGEFVGAPAYVSPEQVLGKPATAASDLYSVGVIAFELFTGAVPFADAGSGGAMLIAKASKRAPSLATLRPDLDRRLVDWVDRLLERDPARRPDGATAARELLDDAAEAALGARWRREAPLLEGLPAPVNRETTQPLPTLPLSRRLLVNALVRPMNLLVAALVAVAGVILEPWLFLVAAATYVGLVLITYFDPKEAQRVAEAGRSSPRPE
jgi:serine/threonine protein kinase